MRVSTHLSEDRMTDHRNWVEGFKGESGDDEESRAWCDDMLRGLGAELLPEDGGLTITLTLPLQRLAGLTADLVHTALAEVLDETYFTVTGTGHPSEPLTPHDMGQVASQLLTEMKEVLNFENALSQVSTALSEKSRELRIQGYNADADQACAGWAADDGPFKHGRLKAY
ncbi:hypothetical protein [Deinococcus sp. QL22]|uniref:hypothetical protein n=1 Tax=Deinococcus sp. QL22 TaxID=2939437 RepID=UPI002016C5DD|nr:hypothetical protein [Deinococcus sp. QL22]UQN08840.1 hypothetical protein M1R55_19795 [Deinococcus sp. QL22]